jgi:hypothetical protein
VSFALSEPSETVKVMVDVPVAFATGVMVPVQLGAVPDQTTAEFATTEVLDELIDTEAPQVSVESTSPMVKLTALAVSSFVEVSAMLEIVGASLSPFTVSTKGSAAVREPSETVRVMVEVPVAFVAGVMVAVQLGAVPDQTTAEFATTEVFEELMDTDEPQLSVESTSVIEKETALAVSSLVEVSD